MRSFATQAQKKKHSDVRNVEPPCPPVSCPAYSAQQNKVRQILRSSKFNVGVPNDIHEQEADRCADEVMSMPVPVRR